MSRHHRTACCHVGSAAILAAALACSAVAATPTGEVKGSAAEHDPVSSAAVVDGAHVALPASVTGGAIYAGLYRDAPSAVRARAPVVVFLHGSSARGPRP